MTDTADTGSDGGRQKLDQAVGQLHDKLDEVAQVAEDKINEAAQWVQQTATQVQQKLTEWQASR